MNKEKELVIVESIQQTVDQMRMDDIEELPESAFEDFQCDCCGNEKILAGSLVYSDYHLCNECVLTAETSFAFNKISTIDDLIKSTKDKRFENVYNSLFENKNNASNPIN